MKKLMPLLVLVVILLHQDFWLWTNRTLVFGFLPIGLAYHVCYSILASLTMWALVHFVWPKHLEEIEIQEDAQAGISPDSREARS